MDCNGFDVLGFNILGVDWFAYEAEAAGCAVARADVEGCVVVEVSWVADVVEVVCCVDAVDVLDAVFKLDWAVDVVVVMLAAAGFVVHAVDAVCCGVVEVDFVEAVA